MISLGGTTIGGGVDISGPGGVILLGLLVGLFGRVGLLFSSDE